MGDGWWVMVMVEWWALRAARVVITGERSTNTYRIFYIARWRFTRVRHWRKIAAVLEEREWLSRSIGVMGRCAVGIRSFASTRLDLPVFSSSSLIRRLYSFMIVWLSLFHRICAWWPSAAALIISSRSASNNSCYTQQYKLFTNQANKQSTKQGAISNLALSSHKNKQTSYHDDVNATKFINTIPSDHLLVSAAHECKWIFHLYEWRYCIC